MKGRLGFWIIAGMFVGIFSLLLGLGVGWLQAKQTTTSRLSPDETLRVLLVDFQRQFIDRNFSIRLDRLETGETFDLLAWSPDEGRPEGTERFLWSKDGTKVLLVGRHFSVRDDLLLDNGDQAYFLHDLKVGRSWINSNQNNRLSLLTADLIAGIEFTEPVVLKPRAKVDPDLPKKSE